MASACSHSVKSSASNHRAGAVVTMQPVVRTDTEVIVWVEYFFGDIAVMIEAKLAADGLTAALFTNTDIHC